MHLYIYPDVGMYFFLIRAWDGGGWEHGLVYINVQKGGEVFWQIDVASFL